MNAWEGTEEVRGPSASTGVRLPAFPKPSPTYLWPCAEQTLPFLLSHLHGLCFHQPLHLGFATCLDSAHILGGHPALPDAPEPLNGRRQRPLAGAPHHSCHVGPAQGGEGAGSGRGGTWKPPGPRSLPPAAGEGPQVQCPPPDLFPLPRSVLHLQSGLSPEQWALPCKPCPGPWEPLKPTSSPALLRPQM
ncbi:transmembrane protein 205 isoform X3 [Mustela erminea]|uniref:transmembrane protein 205 isoform X3 n=1 Tax=Mustela erminea TaxID=36723 RepID=UPI001386D905|nr:transmembrane protein 205 isoform X3 [Mustela erminea]